MTPTTDSGLSPELQNIVNQTTDQHPNIQIEIKHLTTFHTKEKDPYLVITKPFNNDQARICLHTKNPWYSFFCITDNGTFVNLRESEFFTDQFPLRSGHRFGNRVPFYPRYAPEYMRIQEYMPTETAIANSVNEQLFPAQANIWKTELEQSYDQFTQTDETGKTKILFPSVKELANTFRHQLDGILPNES